jgi:hypothetical protein
VDPAKRIVTSLPLTELWSSAGIVDARRAGNIGRADIVRLLQGGASLVVANSGQPLTVDSRQRSLRILEGRNQLPPCRSGNRWILSRRLPLAVMLYRGRVGMRILNPCHCCSEIPLIRQRFLLYWVRERRRQCVGWRAEEAVGRPAIKRRKALHENVFGHCLPELRP